MGSTVEGGGRGWGQDDHGVPPLRGGRAAPPSIPIAAIGGRPVASQKTLRPETRAIETIRPSPVRSAIAQRPHLPGVPTHTAVGSPVSTTPGSDERHHGVAAPHAASASATSRVWPRPPASIPMPACSEPGRIGRSGALDHAKQQAATTLHVRSGSAPGWWPWHRPHTAPGRRPCRSRGSDPRLGSNALRRPRGPRQQPIILYPHAMANGSIRTASRSR